MPMTYKKKSSTIVLIGDSGSNKTHVLQLLYAACLGTDAEKFFSLKDELPSPGKVVGGSSFYTIQQTDGTELNVLDTPELGDTDDENKATEITHAIKSLVTTIDAVVVVADHAKTVLSAAVVQTLKAIFFLFPRPIKGTYFLPTNPANTDPSFDLAWENYSSWFLEDQFFGSVENIVDLRRDLQARHAKPSSIILKAFSKSFGRALQTLRGLLQEVESSSIEAWDIKHLYLRATKIESSIHHALSPGDGTSAHSDDPTPTTAGKDIQKVVELVEEYLLLSNSPDFVTHLGLVIALLRTNPDVENLDCLEDANKALQALEKGIGEFPKGFVVC